VFKLNLFAAYAIGSTKWSITEMFTRNYARNIGRKLKRMETNSKICQICDREFPQPRFSSLIGNTCPDCVERLIKQENRLRKENEKQI